MIAVNLTKWFLHPILIFILSTVALVTSLFLYIHWYLEASVSLRAVIDRFHIDTGQALASQTWVVILVLSLLVGVILLGIFSIFVYGQKTFQLYRLQNNFINSFTHELKTPVTSLQLFLQTLTKHELSREDQLKYVQYMLTDVSRLSDNIDRILNLARIESKSYVHEFVDADLRSTIEHFFKDNAHLFHNSRVRVHPPAEPLRAYRIHPLLFDMLLMNLATNALKYNDADTPRIDVRFERRSRRLLIHFEDNGIGMDRKEIPRIFRKFYQIGQADNMSARGSGIGLYLVRTIAHIHKWRVTAHSEGLGHGSTFTLVLPG
jgi:signal transduction histidine kinase